MAKLKTTTKKEDTSFDKVVAETAAERNAAPKMTPLEDEYEMLAGYTDENGTLHKTFEIRQLNGEDEEALARYSNSTAAKIIPAILERCVTRIGTIVKDKTPKKKWHDIIDNLYVADQDYIMMHIRETSIGEALETRHKCPECGNLITTYLTVDELDRVEWDGEDGIPFELTDGVLDRDGNLHTKGIIKYPRGKDRVATIPFAVKNPARGRTMLLARLVVFEGDIPANETTLRKMSMRDRNYLQNLLNDKQFGLDMSIQVECPECGNTFDGKMAATANFI